MYCSIVTESLPPTQLIVVSFYYTNMRLHVSAIHVDILGSFQYMKQNYLLQFHFWLQNGTKMFGVMRCIYNLLTAIMYLYYYC
jgi:hypothetical protein